MVASDSTDVGVAFIATESDNGSEYHASRWSLPAPSEGSGQ